MSKRHVRLGAVVAVGGRLRRLGIRARASAILYVGEAHLDEVFAIGFMSRPILVLVLMEPSVLAMQSGARKREQKGADLPRSSTVQPDTIVSEEDKKGLKSYCERT